MPEAARVGDIHTCPQLEGAVPHVGGPIKAPGSPDVEIEGSPAARTTDLVICAVAGPDVLNMGSGTVFINDHLAVRKGDSTLHGGAVITGAATVEIGIPGDGVVVKVDAVAGGMASGGRKGADKDCGGHGDNTMGGGKGKGESSKAPNKTHPQPQDPIARFDLFSMGNQRQVNLMKDIDDLIEGAVYEARSTSYDPDDTPTAEPLVGIVSHFWFASFALGEGSSGAILTFKAPKEGMGHNLFLKVTDAEGRSATRGVSFNTRNLKDCKAAHRVKVAAQANIFSASYLMGRPQTARTWSHWLSGSGTELVYDTNWYRSYFSVKDAESDFALRALAEAESKLGGGKGQIQLSGSGNLSVKLYFELADSDLGTTMGPHTLRYHYQASAFQLDDDTVVQGSVRFEAQDRFNWQKGKAFPSLVGADIPGTDVAIPIPMLVADTYWQIMEDCEHAAPFNMKVTYELGFQFARTPFGPVIRWK